MNAGNFDGDTDNDLLPNSDDATPLSTTSTDEQIYNNFGQTCECTRESSQCSWVVTLSSAGYYDIHVSSYSGVT